MAYSILCFMCGNMSRVWRMLNKGALHQEGESVFAIEQFQCVADQVWVVLLAVGDQVLLTNWVVFSALHFLVFVFTSVGCVECHVTNCCGLWCKGSNALFQRSSLLQQLICHVEAGLGGALSDVELFFFCFRVACAVVTQISC